MRLNQLSFLNYSMHTWLRLNKPDSKIFQSQVRWFCGFARFKWASNLKLATRHKWLLFHSRSLSLQNKSSCLGILKATWLNLRPSECNWLWQTHVTVDKYYFQASYFWNWTYLSGGCRGEISAESDPVRDSKSGKFFFL
jgi:hypothetical protein